MYLYVKGELKRDLEDIEFNEKIYKSLLDKRSINRKDLKTMTDRLGVTLGFPFDINYQESFNILNETKYMDTIIDIYKEKTNSIKLKEQLEEIRKVINEYIEVNLC